MRLKISVHGFDGAEQAIEAIKPAVQALGYEVKREYKGQAHGRTESVILEVEKPDSKAA